MNEPSLERRLLEFVASTDYRPLKPSRIAVQLGLEGDQIAELRRIVKRLARRGQLQYLSNHLVSLPKTMPAPKGKPDRPVSREASKSRESSSAEATHQGVIRLAGGGFGFVHVAGNEFVEDVFIPPTALESAMDGDQVEIRTRQGRQGRQEGRVVRIVERARRQFIGTFQTHEGKPTVWLDGAGSNARIQVGDVRGLPLEEGDKVVVEMVRYPTERVGGEGVVMEVLGNSKNPAIDTISVMRQYGLVEEFPEKVIEQARILADSFTETIPTGRVDLTATPTLTIDPTDARDFDDAISLCKNDVGNWELQVHIADVAHFVPEDTPLDLEAKQRATSVYLPDKVIPMLPEIISNHLASLQPDKKRLAKTVLLEYTPAGSVVHCEFKNSVIQNAKRLTYEQVDQYLADPEAERTRLTPAIWQLLHDMHELAMHLRRLRMQKGALELSLPETKIDLDRSGKVKGAHLVLNTVSHQIIEEFMLAANEAVATWFAVLNVPFMRRVHPIPKEEKMRRLTEFLRSLGIECKDLRDRFEMQRVIDSVRATGSEYGVNYAVLKSMSKAVYQPEEDRHYALNLAHYCHFTSPIRRYPDLLVHRSLDQLIAAGLDRYVPDSSAPRPHLAKQVGPSEATLGVLGYHCSQQEQNAEAAERELVRLKLLHFMSRRIGDILHGTICNLNPTGFLVRGNELPVEGFVPIETLPTDRYRFDRQTHCIEGFRHGNAFRLGDEISVEVERVDLAKRELVFRVIGASPRQVASRGANSQDRSQPKKRRPPDRFARGSERSSPPAKKQGPRPGTKGSRPTKKGQPKRRRDERGQ